MFSVLVSAFLSAVAAAVILCIIGLSEENVSTSAAG